MLALAIAISVAAFFFLFISLTLLQRADSKREVKRRLGSLMTVEEEKEEENPDDLRRIPFLKRTVGRMIGRLMEFLAQFAPATIPKLMEKKIMIAGKQGVWKVRHFAGFWSLCILLGAGMGIWYIRAENFTLAQDVLVLAGWIATGALVPFGILNHIIRKRQDLISRQLPDVLDLLSISVQAGLSFDGALRKVVGRMDGPLIDELTRMLRDVRMGMTRRRSMQFMAKRCDIQDIYLFVMSITQSERLGASMSDTLAIQADNMRNIRRQRARAAAMKAPVKMVFPLVFCIFPAIFVVVLVPSLLSLMQTMGK